MIGFLTVCYICLICILKLVTDCLDFILVSFLNCSDGVKDIKMTRALMVQYSECNVIVQCTVGVWVHLHASALQEPGSDVTQVVSQYTRTPVHGDHTPALCWLSVSLRGLSKQLESIHTPLSLSVVKVTPAEKRTSELKLKIMYLKEWLYGSSSC